MGHMDIGVVAGTADTIGGEATTAMDAAGARSYDTTSVIYELAGSGATGLDFKAVSMWDLS